MIPCIGYIYWKAQILSIYQSVTNNALIYQSRFLRQRLANGKQSAIYINVLFSGYHSPLTMGHDAAMHANWLSISPETKWHSLIIRKLINHSTIFLCDFDQSMQHFNHIYTPYFLMAHDPVHVNR
jgi:hypothetical protein